jgi:hypothetical protein
MQVTAFYQQHWKAVVGGGALLSVYLLWRLVFNVASVFVSFEASLIEYEFLALSAALTVLAALYVKRRLDINPDQVREGYQAVLLPIDLL